MGRAWLRHQWLPPKLSLLSIGEAAARLIDKTSTAANVVIGHSMGGQIAPRVCRLIPEKIDALVISATIGFFGNKTKEEQDEFVRQRSGRKLSEAKMAEASRAQVTSMFAPGAEGSEIELVRETAARTPQDTFRAAIQAIKSASDDDAIDAIKGIRAPAEMSNHLKAHLEYQISLEKQGIMYGAGPAALPGESAPAFGLIIIRAKTLQEAQRIADNDPLTIAGVRTYKLYQWSMNEGRISITLDFSDRTYQLN
jgi:uncharacterized protein YciI